MPPQNDTAHKSVDQVKQQNAKLETKSLTETTVQVDDKLYNAESLATIHPGGQIFVQAFAGRDATEAFLSYHRRTFPHQKMVEHLVGNAVSVRDCNDKEYLELCQRVEAVLPRHKSFAPLSYYLKITGLMTLALGLEYYIHSTNSYRWYLTGPLGFLFALVGMNIQHDANHGAISRSATVNRLLGLSQNWIGGSAIDWIHQHVVQHHIAPNDCEKDPDIVGNPLLRLNPLRPLLKHQRLQHLYVFLLLILFGAIYIAFALVHVVQGFHFTEMSALLRQTRTAEALGFTVYFFRWLVLPVLRTSSLSTLLGVLPMYIVGGYYLSFFFIISHNFEGVYLEEAGAGVTSVATSSASASIGNTGHINQQGMGFLRRQVATASNVGGAGLCFLNGGLNYQIEHHLFPRVQHSHYPTIAPVVRAYCEEKGIPYIHFPTVMENVASCARHLYTLGHEDHPKGFQSLANNKKAETKKVK